MNFELSNEQLRIEEKTAKPTIELVSLSGDRVSLAIITEDKEIDVTLSAEQANELGECLQIY